MGEIEVWVCVSVIYAYIFTWTFPTEEKQQLCWEHFLKCIINPLSSTNSQELQQQEKTLLPCSRSISTDKKFIRSVFLFPVFLIKQRKNTIIIKTYIFTSILICSISVYEGRLKSAGWSTNYPSDLNVKILLWCFWHGLLFNRENNRIC